MIHYTKLTAPIGTIGHQILILDHESFESFKTLLNRALNTWDDAPPELKALADTIIYGQQLQDYNNLPR